jgi:hypothetical protein
MLITPYSIIVELISKSEFDEVGVTIGVEVDFEAGAGNKIAGFTVVTTGFTAVVLLIVL